MKKIIILIFLPLCFLFFGCAQMMANKAVTQMQAGINNAVGCTEAEVIRILGAPQKIEDIGNMRIFHYYQSYGTQSKGFVNTFNSGGFGKAQTWESYDHVQFIFENGYVVGGKANAQR